MRHWRRLSSRRPGVYKSAWCTSAGRCNEYVEVVAPQPPPVQVIEVEPAARYGYVWSRGYWRWEGGRYVAVHGHWEQVREGYRYVHPHWVQRNDGYHWQGGGWVR